MPDNLYFFSYNAALPIWGLWSPSVSNRDMYITCSFLLFVGLFVLLFVLVQHISPVLILPKGLVII